MNEQIGEETEALTKQQRKEEKRQQREAARQYEQRRLVIKRWFMWSVLAIVLVLITGGVIWQSGQSTSGGASTSAGKVLGLEVTDTDHFIGNPEAKVVVIEYADLQCPACAVYHQAVQQMAGELDEKVKIVFRHFPLRSIHSNADLAAQAAEAAHRQNKFWEMVDLLYQRQTDWSVVDDAQEIFLAFARELGINEEQFREDIQSGESKARIDRDYQSALKLGLNSTPSFFINGQELTSLRGTNEFRRAIEQQIASNY